MVEYTSSMLNIWLAGLRIRMIVCLFWWSSFIVCLDRLVQSRAISLLCILDWRHLKENRNLKSLEICLKVIRLARLGRDWLNCFKSMNLAYGMLKSRCFWLSWRLFSVRLMLLLVIRVLFIFLIGLNKTKKTSIRNCCWNLYWFSLGLLRNLASSCLFGSYCSGSIMSMRLPRRLCRYFSYYRR